VSDCWLLLLLQKTDTWLIDMSVVVEEMRVLCDELEDYEPVHASMDPRKSLDDLVAKSDQLKCGRDFNVVLHQ